MGNLVGGLVLGLTSLRRRRGDIEPDGPADELFLGDGIASELDLKWKLRGLG